MPIRADQLKEREDYQQLILERLHEENGYRIRPAEKFSPGLAMDTEMLWEFLEDTQEDTLSELRSIYKENTRETVINYINSEINKDSRGLIDVIKHGVEFDSGYKIELMYRLPDSDKNPEAKEQYEKNILSVMEEVWHKEDERIDLVLFLNGLAIFAVELKCNTSGQDYEDAIKQYKLKRDSSTRLLREKVGVPAAFAMISVPNCAGKTPSSIPSISAAMTTARAIPISLTASMCPICGKKSGRKIKFSSLSSVLSTSKKRSGQTPIPAKRKPQRN